MKSTVCFFGLLLAAPVFAAEPASIYHTNWIDLDKNGRQDVYENPAQPVAKRVADLLKRMTIEEKIGQLWQVDLSDDADKKNADKLRRGEIGSFLGGSKTIESPVMWNKLQKIAVEQSRLGIPLIFGHDVIHGFRTQFPIPLAQACAWEPALFEQTGTIAAREAAAAGIAWTFAPMADLARDPRWGRIAEGFGEDPFLGALDAAASVRGFQGTNVADADRVVACLKHYVGYGAAEGGRDYNTTEISEYTLRNFYLPQFHAGVDAGLRRAEVLSEDGRIAGYVGYGLATNVQASATQAGALTLMSAFNCLSGVPSSGNRHTLTDILRGEWKFPGFVVSDYNSVLELINHGVAADTTEAARLGLTAGVDMEMVSTTYRDTLKKQVAQGTVSQKTLDEAVRRVLTVKFEKGLFDRPFTDEARCQNAFLRDDALALSRAAAAKSCVLLKNENAALPLSPSAKKIALLGPFADNAQELVGPWHSRAHKADVVSLVDALRGHLASADQLAVARGCPMLDASAVKVPLDIDTFAPIKEAPLGSNEIAEAAELAKSADVVVLALGEPLDWSGESASRTDLGLPGRQQELLDAVAATGKPVVVVLFNGRPLALAQVAPKAAAILEAWFPGTQGAHGVADVLFGAAEPAGRLTTTFPRNVGQVPFHYNHYNTGRPGFGDYHGNYVDAPTTPLYPFGFGLAYTTFEFGKVVLAKNKISLDGKISASAEIKNTGARAGTAVAELYLRAFYGSAGPRPVRELKGFKKIILQPGETKTVNFELAAKDLGCFDAQGKWLVDAGQYQLWIAADAASGEPAAFQLVK